MKLWSAPPLRLGALALLSAAGLGCSSTFDADEQAFSCSSDADCLDGRGCDLAARRCHGPAPAECTEEHCRTLRPPTAVELDSEDFRVPLIDSPPALVGGMRVTGHLTAHAERGIAIGTRDMRFVFRPGVDRLYLVGVGDAVIGRELVVEGGDQIAFAFEDDGANMRFKVRNVTRESEAEIGTWLRSTAWTGPLLLVSLLTAADLPPLLVADVMVESLDGRGCSVSGCDEAGACARELLPDGSACDDGSLCTPGADSCNSAGVCSGAPLVCAEGEHCDPAVGCVPIVHDGTAVQ